MLKWRLDAYRRWLTMREPKWARVDYVLGQAFGGLVGFDIGDEPVLVLVDIDVADPLDGLLHGRHFFLRYGFKDRG
jgi:hypothetical protein